MKINPEILNALRGQVQEGASHGATRTTTLGRGRFAAVPADVVNQIRRNIGGGDVSKNSLSPEMNLTPQMLKELKLLLEFLKQLSHEQLKKDFAPKPRAEDSLQRLDKIIQLYTRLPKTWKKSEELKESLKKVVVIMTTIIEKTVEERRREEKQETEEVRREVERIQSLLSSIKQMPNGPEKTAALKAAAHLLSKAPGIDNDLPDTHQEHSIARSIIEAQQQIENLRNN